METPRRSAWRSTASRACSIRCAPSAKVSECVTPTATPEAKLLNPILWYAADHSDRKDSSMSNLHLLRVDNGKDPTTHWTERAFGWTPWSLRRVGLVGALWA